MRKIADSTALYELIAHQENNEGFPEIVLKDVCCEFDFGTYSFDEFLKRIIFENVTFRNIFSFQGNHFKEKVEIRKSTFNDLRISACGFHDELTIENCTFHSKLVLTDSAFYGLTRFFKNDFLGGTNIFEKHDSYGAVEFKGGLVFY